jgi:hypothetical protein
LRKSFILLLLGDQGAIDPFERRMRRQACRRRSFDEFRPACFSILAYQMLTEPGVEASASLIHAHK